MAICLDLFVSRVNYQRDRCVAWQPDPGAWQTDAFSLDWNEFSPYCSPQNSTNSKTDRNGIQSHCAFVGYPTLVHETTSSADRHTSTFAQDEDSRDPSFDGESASNLTQNPVSCMQAVREVLQKSGIPGKIVDIIPSAWRSRTSKAYNF